MKTINEKGNTSIPSSDNKSIRVTKSPGLSSDLNLFQPSPQTTRLPSFQHTANRQKLSLTTRKCLSSNVTPISSPIIPRNPNNNYRQPVREFSKEVIESSAKLINDIDVTLSQLSKQYYSDNNNSFETTPINDEDITPTSQINNNCLAHFSTLTNDSCDCQNMNKLKLKKSSCPTTSSQDPERTSTLPKSLSKQSHIPSPFKDVAGRQKSIPLSETLTSRPTKLPFNNCNRPPEMAYYTMSQESSRKSSKSSSRRSKSSTINPKLQPDATNSNPTYTEAWVYNSQLPSTVKSKQITATNDLLNYIECATSQSQNYAESGLPIYQTNSNTTLFQKSIFTQHRHNRSEASQSPKFPPKIPLPSRKIKNCSDENITNRDSGIFSSSCSKESSADSSSEIRANSHHQVQVTLPQPPPRISSLVNTSQSAVSRCPTLTNQACTSSKDYLGMSKEAPKQASKSDRRKARELFASVKQRDDSRKAQSVDNDVVPSTQEKSRDISTDSADCAMVSIKKEVQKCEVAETPNSDLESGTVEGYCSDMDNLKNSGYCSDNSGYMSEGGLGLYAQKMQQRFREGLLAVQESLQMTSHNKIQTTRVGSFDRDDISSTSSEEIEDYLKELSSRLVSPNKLEDTKKSKDTINSRKIAMSRCHGNDSLELQAQRKNRIYQERLEKYACDVEPAADFDITSSCSMDLLTGKVVSETGSEEYSIENRALQKTGGDRSSGLNICTNIYDYGNYSGRKSSVDSGMRSRLTSSNKSRQGTTEILEAAGPTPATFEDDNGLGIMSDGESNHYRAMSLPGRPRRNNGWQGETASLSRDEEGYMFPLAPPPSQTTSNIYYDVPVCHNRVSRPSGNSTPSLMNVRLPYATLNQGVKNSLSTTSLGKRDADSDDIYDGLGSHLSLLSAGSYRSLNEERQATEIRKLRRELELAQSKVRTLSGQLTNNGTLVAAFEGTLQSMSMRLQKFAANSESKESELNDLKNTIESLKKQAGSSPIPDQTSPKIYSASSLTSLSSTSNSNEKRSDGTIKKSSWFKNSLGRAFRKKSSKEDGSTESINDIPNKENTETTSNVQSMTESESLQALRKELEEKDARLTDVQLDALSRSHQLEQLRDLLTKMRYEMSSLKADNNRLQNLMTLSNGTLSSQSLDQSIGGDTVDHIDQINTLKTISKFKDLNVKPKFDFLNALVKEVDLTHPLMVYIIMKNVNKVVTPSNLPLTDDITTIPIGQVGIGSITSWSDLENSIRRLLKEYVSAIDPFTNLGLSGESISRYRINNDTFIPICSTGGMRPLTSPLASCDNVADSKIYLELKNHTNGNSIDDMVFEFLIPKPILLRYFGLLLDHKRIILSGPSGTGKSYLANKLAWNLASRYNRDPASSILVFNLDQKSTKELRGYMATLTEQLLKTDPHCEISHSSTTSCLPLVIILDNLHHVSSFSEIFNSFLSIHHNRSPFVIGTMNQSNTIPSNNLQLHHNFRWVLCTNHMEPVKGFLGRFLRRQFLKHQIETRQSHEHLYHVIEWISIVWQHINKFLETYSSADVTLGPRLFLSCPMSIDKSKTWFVDLWNYSLVPYVLDAVRDGLSTHGRKQATWDDPTDWIVRSWPWSDLGSPADTANLIRLRPEDVGFDSYQLLTTAGSAAAAGLIGPYPVSGHLAGDSLAMSAGRRVPRSGGDKVDQSDALVGMLLRLQDKGGHQRKN